jgi:hypothetical protein
MKNIPFSRREGEADEANPVEKTFLDEVDLRHAELARACFRAARIRGARLEGANLSSADFRSADLTGASMRNANLTQADFRGTDLTIVTLDGSDIDGASFWVEEQDDMEQYLGVTPAMVLATNNWRTASFSPGFSELLCAEQANAEKARRK